MRENKNKLVYFKLVVWLESKIDAKPEPNLNNQTACGPTKWIRSREAEKISISREDRLAEQRQISRVIR